MLTEKHFAILAALRQDARRSLAQVSRETGIASSTVFDYFSHLSEQAVLKFTTIPSFHQLGYPLHKKFLLKSRNRQRALEWLQQEPHVNNLYRVDGHDAFFEAFFADMQQLEEFKERMEEALKPKRLQEFDILEVLKQESFVPRHEPSSITT